MLACTSFANDMFYVPTEMKNALLVSGSTKQRPTLDSFMEKLITSLHFGMCFLIRLFLHVINCNVCHALIGKNLSMTTPFCRKIWSCTPLSEFPSDAPVSDKTFSSFLLLLHSITDSLKLL